MGHENPQPPQNFHRVLHVAAPCPGVRAGRWDDFGPTRSAVIDRQPWHHTYKAARGWGAVGIVVKISRGGQGGLGCLTPVPASANEFATAPPAMLAQIPIGSVSRCRCSPSCSAAAAASFTLTNRFLRERPPATLEIQCVGGVRVGLPWRSGCRRIRDPTQSRPV